MITFDDLKQDARELSHWQQHRFIVLIVWVLLVSFFLVSVALSLYNSSGAAQLDLSRPSYQAVRSQASREETTKSFPSSGVLNDEVMEEFDRAYKERSAKVESVESFDEKALTDESLRIFAPSSEVSTR